MALSDCQLKQLRCSVLSFGYCAAMRRRDFIILATAWPFVAHAQQVERVRSIGILLGVAADDPQGKAMISALLQGLQEFGWVDGRNAKIYYRGASNPDDLGKYATELAMLAPDVMVATGGTSAGPLLRASKTIPIVFANVPDPVGSGFIESLSRPGGNATGFVQFEYSLSGKWLELLKQIAPDVRSVAVLWDPTIIAGVGQFAVIQSVAPALGVEVRGINVRDAAEIESAVATFANFSNGGMVVTASALAFVHRDLIVTIAARHKLPTVYFQRVFVTGGGLISYGPDFLDQYRRAAGYIDRVLKGEKPGDLPVQAPTKYELTINLKTAKTLGLTVPRALLARTDDTIE
jgi:putative ABC transport system substrate-binding protein